MPFYTWKKLRERESLSCVTLGENLNGMEGGRIHLQYGPKTLKVPTTELPQQQNNKERTFLQRKCNETWFINIMWTDRLSWTSDNDGIFFMSYKDFCSTFDVVHINYINDSWFYSNSEPTKFIPSNSSDISMKHLDPSRKSVLLINCSEPGLMTISVTQKDRYDCSFRFCRLVDRGLYLAILVIVA